MELLPILPHKPLVGFGLCMGMEEVCYSHSFNTPFGGGGTQNYIKPFSQLQQLDDLRIGKMGWFGP